jgi:WD40 repeat protein
MSHIFISYSRRDLAFAQKIVDALAVNKLDTWIDWKSIPKGEDWEQEIYRGIEEADAFLFLISPDSVKSEMCNKEIAHAVKNGKRMLPIVLHDTDRKIIHPEIAKRNWIFCRHGQDDFDKAIKETYETIHTDYEWLKYQTQLQVKALDWDRGKDNSRLLRGKELRDAEEKLADVGTQIDPRPTILQRQYILSSQRNEIRVRRQVVFGLVTGLVLVLIFALVALEQRNEAMHQTNIARAGELAALADASKQTRLDLALLLSIEAVGKEDRYQTENVLLAILQSTPGLNRIVTIHNGDRTLALSPAGDGTIEGYAVRTIALSNNGKTLASVGCGKPNSRDYHCDQGELLLIDTESLQGIGRFVFSGEPFVDITSNIRSVDFSPDGKLLALGTENGDVILWDTAAHQVTGPSLLGHTDVVFDVAFSPDGKILASASGQYDKTILLWDVATHKQIGQPIVGHTGSITSLDFSSDGKVLASGGGDGGDRSIILWDMATHEPIGQPLTGHTGGILALSFSPDGKTIASGSSDNTIIIWDVSTHQPIAQPLRGHNDIVLSLAFSPDGRRLASGSWDRSILVWDLETLKVAWQFEGHLDSIRGLAFTPDGKTLISGSDDYSIRFWDMEGFPQPFPTIKQYYSGTYGNGNLTFIDGNNILATSGGGTIHHFRIDTSESTVRELVHVSANKPDLLTGLAFSPDMKLFATGTCREGTSILCEQGEINFWGVDAAQQIGDPLTGKFGWVQTAIFSPDSRLLITGSCGRREENFVCVQGEISIWDIGKQKAVIELTGHTTAVYSLAISPDGRTLASGADDGTIILWDLANHQMIGQPFLGHADTVLA